MAVKSKAKKAQNKAAPKAMRAISEKQTKMQILRAIAQDTGLPLKQVQHVFALTSHMAKCHLIKRGSGEFSIPEMAIKVVRKTKPATKERQGRNPITGESITISAKPKRDVIKVRPLKSLKEVLMQG